MKNGFIFLIVCVMAVLALGDTAIGEKNFGIITVPVANLREKPAHSSGLADQEIMGYTVKLLKRKDNWFEVQTEYGYTGWMTDKSFYRVDEAAKKKWDSFDKVIVTKIFTIVYSKPDEKSEPVTNVVLNCLLRRIEKNYQWTIVETADGRAGFLKNEDIAQMPIKKLSGKELQDSLIKTAKSMMGVPYLWGGKSSAASDCSGFTQTVFRASAINLLRDSRQQVTEGDEVIYDSNFSNVKAGDLLFFGSDKITHVAMSLGGADFIHQSGDVHINSLDPKASNYSPFHRKNLKAIRRVIK